MERDETTTQRGDPTRALLTQIFHTRSYNNMAQSRRQGYYLLAELMSWSSNTAIFPRFKSSNLLNLLLLQAEISKLEEDLRDFVDLDQKSGQASRVNASLDWEALWDLDEDHPTRKTLGELRERLSVYSE